MQVWAGFGTISEPGAAKGLNLNGERRTTMADESTTKSAPSKPTRHPNHEAIAEIAYCLWILRARPIGSPEVDWYRAEQELRLVAKAA